MHSACGCSSITHICSSTESTVNSTIHRQVLSWPTRLLVAWKSIVNVPNQKVALLPKSVFFFHLVLNLSQWFSNRIAASYIEQCIIPLLFHNFEASQDNCSNPLNFNHLQCHFIVCKDTHKACSNTTHDPWSRNTVIVHGIKYVTTYCTMCANVTKNCTQF